MKCLIGKFVGKYYKDGFTWTSDGKIPVADNQYATQLTSYKGIHYPDFDKMSETFTLMSTFTNENFNLSLEARLLVKSAREYNFKIKADDSCDFYLDDKFVATIT